MINAADTIQDMKNVTEEVKDTSKTALVSFERTFAIQYFRRFVKLQASQIDFITVF